MLKSFKCAVPFAPYPDRSKEEDGQMIRENFEYDETKSESYNFAQWYLMNTEEREGVGEAPYTQYMARMVFDKLRSSGWLTKSQSADGRGKSAES